MVILFANFVYNITSEVKYRKILLTAEVIVTVNSNMLYECYYC